MASPVILCYLAVAAAEALAYYDAAFMPPSAHMLLLSLCTVYLGCHLSLEQEVSERMTSSEAVSFPLVAGAGLTGLFLAFKYFDASVLNSLLRLYFVLIGIATVGDFFRPLIPARLVARLEPVTVLQCRVPLLGSIRFSVIDTAVYAVGGALSISYGLTQHWLGNNLLGMAFCVSGIGRISVGSYQTAVLVLAALLVYDVVMVYGTPMMIAVATKVDAPIKLLMPTGHPDHFGRPGFSLLGLGDIVVPGILLALLLRFDTVQYLLGKAAKAKGGATDADSSSGSGANDASSSGCLAKAAELVHAPFAKPVFTAAWAAYSAGLMLTIWVMHTFRHGQPALFYLVPATVLASAGAALVNGSFGRLLKFDDNDYLSLLVPSSAAAAVAALKDGGDKGKAAAVTDEAASAPPAGEADADAAPAASSTGPRQRRHS